MKILTTTDFITSNWSGGTTTQLFIVPEGATLSERNFEWRISSALVETEESDFTLFDGYERILIPLQGTLLMEHETPTGILKQEVSAFHLARFSGSWPTKGKGKLTDFNLIFQPEYNPKITVQHFSEQTRNTISSNCTVFYLHTGILHFGGTVVSAPALLVNEDSSETEVQVSGSATGICIEMG